MAERPVRLGIDVGGTFVDCAVLAKGELIAIGKAPTTPADPVRGILEAVDDAAAGLGLTARELLAAADEVVHGSTLGLNTLLTRSGATVGLLATRGHEDALLIGRVHQKVAGLGPDEMIRVSELTKPDPLVPRWQIRGVDERIDADGTVLVPLDEEGVAVAVEDLVNLGCDALAIAFLWSFRNPAHERRAAAIARGVRRALAVSVSSDVAPVLGEYERTAATVVNAYLGRAGSRHLRGLATRLAAAGFGGRLGILRSSGAVMEVADAGRRPVEALRSGPVGGALAAVALGRRLGASELLATDVGGTSFDVALVRNGRPDRADMTVAARLHLAVPSVDVASIGAGGGSIAWLDADGGVHVGPSSAGADPGPACYGRGGREPTVTDADLVLGRLDPTAVLGGRIRLDPVAADQAIGALADRLGVDGAAMAAGIVRVADAHMADLVRRVTIERGHDPRQLLLVAYGGAAGLHAAAYGFAAGAREIVVPPGAGVFSAQGLAGAPRGRSYVRPGPLVAPLDPASVRESFRAMERRARSDMRSMTLDLRREIDFRYRRQTHRLRVPLEAGRIDGALLDLAVERFERDYAAIYGPEAGYRAAGIEAVAARLEAIAGVGSSGEAVPSEDAAARPSATHVRRRRARPTAARRVFFERWVERTPIHDGSHGRPGDTVDGPAVIEWTTTGLVVHPAQTATYDGLGVVHLVREA